MMDGPIALSFERLRRDRGSRLAVAALSEGRSLTFQDLADRAEALERKFARLRLEPGRPVALVVGNDSSFLPLLLACLRLRLVVLPLDGDSPLPEARRVADAFEAQALVTLGAGRVPAGCHGLPGGLVLHPLPGSSRTIDFRGAALLKLTSGSTDVPKAVLCSEANLWHDGEHVVEAMGIADDSIQLGAIPLSHSYGLGNLVVPLLVHGARLVLRHGFIPPAFCRDIETCGVTVFAGVPFMFDRIVGAMGLERLPPPLRTLITAGAPIAAATVHEFKRRFGAKIHSFYGSSETGGIAFDASDLVEDPLTVGTAMPGVTISLEPVAAAPAPGAGRVCVRSSAVGLGYAGYAGDLGDGRFRTADIGRFDEEGRLFLLGRVSQTINVAGRKVQPDEVERVLRDMPGVAEAVVLGLPDPIRGQRLAACVVPATAGITPLAVRRHCAHYLSPYKIPRSILVLDALPLTPRGKIDRAAIGELLKNSE